jgi:hydrogenase expression/formation protein HypE
MPDTATRREAPRLRAVLFDFDATLTKPDALDFNVIRRAIGCPAGSPVLDYIASLPDGPGKEEARSILDRYEMEAAAASLPNDGAEELVLFLKRHSIGRGIITRNTLASVRRALANFTTLTEADFPVIVTRESPGRPKPHPDGVLEAARLLGVEPRETLVVGDFAFDIAAGNAAGAVTALITNGQDPAASPRSLIAASVSAEPDITIARLSEIPGILGLAR